MRTQASYFSGEKFSPMNYFISKNVFPNKLCLSLKNNVNSNRVFELIKEFFSECEIKYDKYISQSANYYNEIYAIKEDKVSPFIIEYKHLSRNLILYSLNKDIEDTLHKISEMCYES